VTSLKEFSFAEGAELRPPPNVGTATSVGITSQN
jgi:hypothetical protein